MNTKCLSALCTLVGFILCSGGIAMGETADHVSYYDGAIVFNFDKSYEIGQFANGDYWVHNNGGTVTITSITPVGKTDSSGRTINGTMQDPIPWNGNEQGYDSATRDMDYNDDLNVDPGNTGNSLIVTPNSSIIKSISMSDSSERAILSDAAVLTVLDSAPSDGSFRPAYTGTDKTIIATVDDLDFDRLGHWPKIGGEEDIDDVAARYERVWLEQCTEWTARDIHPQNNMPSYGRDIAKKLISGLLYLQLDFSDSEKKQLLINMVQYGLDIYGVALDGGEWYNNGGHNQGRKMPMMVAGWVLHNDNILAWADKEQHNIFQDDQQYFYVSQTEVDLTNSTSWDPDTRYHTPEPYTTADIGTAEWGVRHNDKPEGDDASWESTYRDINGPYHTAHMLAAMMMGVRKYWNWEPAFDYADRYFAIERDNDFSTYFISLWDAYRDQEEVVENDSSANILTYIPGILAGRKHK